MLFGLISNSFTVTQNLVMIAMFGVAILIALVLHEWAHAYAALKQGDYTAKLAGRLTLNPAKHIDPLGLLCFCIAGIGWAKPVPVNPFNYRNFKRGNFFVSIAGVSVNFMIAVVCSFGLFMVISNADIWLQNDRIFFGNISTFEFALFFFFFFAMIVNIALMIFNLLPIPPLDGYNLLRSFTKPNNGFMRFMRENALIMLLLIIFFALPMIGALRGIIYDGLMGFWGLFL